MSTAVEMLNRSLSLAPADDPARLDIMPKLASALARTGQLAGAEALLSEAIDEAAAAGDRACELHALVEHASWRLWSDPESEGDARRLAERAIPEFEELAQWIEDALWIASPIRRHSSGVIRKHWRMQA